MTKINTKTLSLQAAGYIREAIRNKQLQPGDKLTELAIADELSTSQGPVREALQMLVSEGLVRIRGKREKHVAMPSAKEVLDSYFAGGVLEGAIVAAAIDNFTDDDMAHIEKIVKRMQDVGEMSDSDKAIDLVATLDAEFHDFLFSKGNKEFVRELWFRSCQVIGKFLFYQKWRELVNPKEIYTRHKKVMEAVKLRDKNLIEQTIREHYNSAGEFFAQCCSDQKEKNNI